MSHPTTLRRPAKPFHHQHMMQKGLLNKQVLDDKERIALDPKVIYAGFKLP